MFAKNDVSNSDSTLLHSEVALDAEMFDSPLTEVAAWLEMWLRGVQNGANETRVAMQLQATGPFGHGHEQKYLV